MKNHNFSHFHNFTFIDVRKMIQKTIKKKKKECAWLSGLSQQKNKTKNKIKNHKKR